ncbi:hypothetical protein FV292_27340 [Escherichia coli]|nr:hypothetical protein FV292_27340 [Escherichia coli]
MTDFGGKTSIFSHPVYLFLRKFSLQDSRGGSLLIDDEQFDEINIVRGQLVPGGRLGIKITELECA